MKIFSSELFKTLGFSIWSREKGGGQGIPDQREKIERFIGCLLTIKCGGKVK